ncbi:MAG: hypothetical protein IJ870_01235 [Alphaproteobacteria bacterium]|nr:hypothetical protein [Alphaproteobacteria bacterium]
MDHDTNKTIYINRVLDSNKKPLGGTVHVYEEVEIESDEPFLDNYLGFGISELTDSQKLKTMDFIQTLTAGKVNFNEAFAYIYLTTNNKNIRSIISQIGGMKEIISKLKAQKLPQNDNELLDFIQENI